MNATRHPKCRTQELQEIITRDFPVYQYHGEVMAVQRDPAVYESEEDNLDIVLAGKTWREIEAKFIEANEDDYLLMSGPAATAFLPAWLWRAAEDLDEHNQVRETLIFHLARVGGSKDVGEGFWARVFRALNRKQQDFLHLLISCAAINGDDAFDQDDKNEIAMALKSIEANFSGGSIATQTL